MSACPKCGKKLRLTDLSQHCPSCGVNMRFYNFEENFYTEAKLAELSMASVKIKLRNLKASFVGSKLTIARLCVMLLPLVSLLFPTANAVLTLPFHEESIGISALGIYNIFSSGTLNFILGMGGSAIAGEAFTALTYAIIAEAALAVLSVLILLFSLLGFLSIKNMQKFVCVFSALGFATTVPAFVLIKSFCNTANNAGGMISGSLSFGLIVTAIMMAVVFVVNFLLVKKGIPVEYDEGWLERAAIYKKVKSGEIKLDDLPQPVVETAETRAIEEEIAREEETFLRQQQIENGEASTK